MSDTTIPLLAAKDARGGILLRAPKLGLWSDPPRNGALVEAGSPAGSLAQLRRRFALIVPDGVSGRVAIEGRLQDAIPVEYGEILFRVTPMASLEAADASSEPKAPGPTRSALAVSAPTDGVFYRAPELNGEPYAIVGDRVRTGQPVGLIEVMKTFNPIAYGGAGLPDEAEIVEILAADGQEVRAGQILVVVRTL